MGGVLCVGIVAYYGAEYPVPRWIIFCLDLLVCIFSLGFAYFLKYNFNVAEIDSNEISRNILVFSILNSVVFLSIKTYTGIIRYTSAQDSFRILFSILISNGLFFIANLLLVSFNQAPYISNVILIINGLTSFLLLITYRVMVKYFFMYMKNFRMDKRRVVIYGAGEAGIAAKRTLDHDNKVNMMLVAFIDDDARKSGKAIDGIKIFHTRDFQLLFKNEKIDDLIIASQNIPPDRKNGIVDICLENDIKVLTLPPVRNWINGQPTAKQLQNIKIEDLLEREPIEIHNDIIGEQIKGKRVLVTGAAGSIGSEIVRQIAQFNPQMIILNDQSETPLHELQLELQENNLQNNFHSYIGDVRDQCRMELLFQTFKPHYVYHAAAYKHVPLMEHNPGEAVRTNVMGTKTIADLSVKYGVSKFVMISTDKAVNPTNVMGASKRIAEIYVQSLYHSFNRTDGIVYSNGLSHLNENREAINTKFITTRFGNVLGSNGSVIPRFKAQIQKGGPITVTHPEITRYFMTIPEACRLVLEAGSMGQGGEIFIFDMGKSVKIVELAKKMIRLSGLVPHQDIAIEFSGLRPGEKLYEELLNDLENTKPTHHEKIMVAQVREYHFQTINKHISDLIKLSCEYKDRQVVVKMKEIVPEFKSNNSIYEELDIHVEIPVKSDSEF
ncbi:NDP-sugar epimerase, includes UDP-GlcNAc-inverting 4,6-dehydratase FlaA1 and capsular polysaccharide biosynthesis protein EpsC [Daejeonella rubra]|uniref:NDP-sugar epimerase, includes UDP-GlcNAc-inverting 4,6-dehydratase FlaA1 and capsular polysaccharide biosynthesis protein EpsC n=1 Tax=Daejeonella rubra TaxID=990371 RepID=A0A1G9Y672_9SPHI|nr:nucleoside-diphosphate sugar epimerase/dehydratase [Daejeonella rubra]SDN04530.1 NDP-sugar epimerase, includes UDP-GlcNAc-inverting 4,6-dehydratase FlaA1 and capsular polysaccharide biosynthesis protein EpsC [Daejeonella rubra]